MAQRRVAWSRAAAAGVAAACCALGIGAAIYGYGCSVYSDALLLPGASDGATQDVLVVDSGTDAHDSGVVDTGAGPCAEVFPPQAPAKDDPSDAGDQTFVVALHTIDIGLGDAGVAGLSYDLDGVYTSAKNPVCGPESCNPASTPAFPHPDGPGGRDDSAGLLIGSLASIDPTFNANAINQNLEAGKYSILLQILHYNGRANDTQVAVALYASLGVESDAGAMWNGNDSWTIDQAFVAVPDAAVVVPNHYDPSAYVSGGVLVMHIDFPISIGATTTTSLTISLRSGVATAVIAPTGTGSYALKEGQIAGRWNAGQLLGAVQALTIFGQPLCPEGATYKTLIKPQVCQYADIMTDHNEDQMGKTCDALSMGIGFTADPALMGGQEPASVKPSLCEAGVGAEPDSCQP